MDYNWLSPKAEARPAGERGLGSFAVEPITAGETGADWRETALQEKYAGRFSPYLARRIAALPVR